MKQATFYLEKIIKDGKEYVKVLSWKNIPVLAELPMEYLDKEPCFYPVYGVRSKIIICLKHNRISFAVGDYISKEDWKKLEKIMKQAGSRLSAILKKKRWHGKFKVEI